MHEEHAKKLIIENAARGESPLMRKKQAQMWLMIGVCTAIFAATYIVIAYKTYDFGEAKASIARAASNLEGFGGQATTVIEESKNSWDGLVNNLTKDAEAKIENQVIEEVKKNINAKTEAPAPTNNE